MSSAYSVLQCIVLYCVHVSFPVSYKLKVSIVLYCVHVSFPVSYKLKSFSLMFCRIPDTLLLSEDVGLYGDEDNFCNFRC
jgi:hypothetical protein